MGILIGVIGLVLSGLGAVTGVQVVRRKMQRRLETRAPQRLLKHESQLHVYKRIEWTAEVAEHGLRWKVVMDATMEAKTDNLRSIDITDSIYDVDSATYDDDVEPATILKEAVR